MICDIEFSSFSGSPYQTTYLKGFKRSVFELNHLLPILVSAAVANYHRMSGGSVPRSFSMTSSLHWHMSLSSRVSSLLGPDVLTTLHSTLFGVLFLYMLLGQYHSRAERQDVPAQVRGVGGHFQALVKLNGSRPWVAGYIQEQSFSTIMFLHSCFLKSILKEVS